MFVRFAFDKNPYPKRVIQGSTQLKESNQAQTESMSLIISGENDKRLKALGHQESKHEQQQVPVRIDKV